MPKRLRYTEEARDDLDGIWRWLIQPGSGRAARRRLLAIRSAINGLRQHPFRYPVLEYPGVREMPCPGGYRAFYVVHPDTGRSADVVEVRILRVYGPGQIRGVTRI